MSDVAVTWAKAQECVDAAGKKDRNAKQTLVHLASYVDALGVGWASVPVLAMEMDVSERSVQRGLRALEAMSLIKATGEKKNMEGRLYPYYQLPLETGHASTARRRKAERAAARGDRVSPQGGENPGSPGDKVSPQDVASVTPRGDTGVTQIGKGITQGFKPSASVRASEAAGKAWATKAPERVAPPRVEASWLNAVERSRETDDRMLSAVRACVARDPDFGRGKAMNLDRWLDEDRFMAWLPDDGALAQAPIVLGWAGPANVKAAVMDAMGEAGVASYLNHAGWDEGLCAVVAATKIGAQRLTDGAGSALKALGVRVMTKGAAHG
ncbi:Uncharacterised protein [Brevundimonas vesicularis]|uniref:Helix-turn-helix domain-containing protein n=1 Tax=Brevundimonas vesicularis TaxID=41276 RepID=A0A2X1D5U3_BREVE|nr:hypothetical protein [Brevundimonas vesicularis]SPU55885.1 Uncharacterised protein [Brevundimonas vesicularis]